MPGLGKQIRIICNQLPSPKAPEPDEAPVIWMTAGPGPEERHQAGFDPEFGVLLTSSSARAIPAQALMAILQIPGGQQS